MSGFLADESLQPLWRAVAAALDRNGVGWRGRLQLPDLPPEGRRRLGVLLDRRIPPGRRAVDLGLVADAVERLAGAELVVALDALGHSPRGRREASDARRETIRRRAEELRAAVAAEFGDTGWAPAWLDAAWRDGLFAGLDPDDAPGLARAVRQVLDAAGEVSPHPRSRSEIAARLFGDAHALDPSTLLAALATRALRARHAADGDDRAVWEAAGLPADLVSAPLLSWGLPVCGDAPVATAVRAMTGAGLPVHLSAMALRAAPLTVPAGTAVLVVENPRLVEAAAQRRLPAPVLTTNGNPSNAVTLALGQLAASGAVLRYHGDFDAAGLGMTERAAGLGCQPWHMGAADYRDAVQHAEHCGVELPRDPAPVPPTPWDRELATEFERRRAVVHEERVMDELLTEHARSAK